MHLTRRKLCFWGVMSIALSPLASCFGGNKEAERPEQATTSLPTVTVYKAPT